MAEDYLRSNGSNVQFLVGLDWCRGDQFSPRLSDGGTCYISEAKEEWCWFLTYVGPGLGSKSNTLGEVSVVRLRDNGKISFVPKIRT